MIKSKRIVVDNPKSTKYYYVILFLFLFFPSSSSDGTALLIMGIQRCNAFGGSLSARQNSNLVQQINQILKRYRPQLETIVFILDYHHPHHISFSSQHTTPLNTNHVILSYNANGDLCEGPSVKDRSRVKKCSCTKLLQVRQSLWPPHCVKDTYENRMMERLDVDGDRDYVLKKGTFLDLGSYSAFFSNGRIKKTELDHHLKKHEISNVIITGFPYEFCLKHTALDAKFLGYKVYVIEDAVESLYSAQKLVASEDMQNKGIKLIQTENINNVLSRASNKKLWFFFGAAIIATAVTSLVLVVLKFRKKRKLRKMKK